MMQPAPAPNKPWCPAKCPATPPIAAPFKQPAACTGAGINQAASARAKAAGISIDFMGVPPVELNGVMVGFCQWKMRKAMIRSGIGTPRSQNSPYFIEFTPETQFCFEIFI
jgi:hypothetical protein